MTKTNHGTPNNNVGYRNPPTSTRFRKGRSGNPRGRRRGDENLLTVFKRIVSKRVRIRAGDSVHIVALAEAVLLKNYEAALQKNQGAMDNIMRLAEKSGELARD